MRGLWVAGLLGLAACNTGGSAGSDAGCQLATDCPEIDCQCSGGNTVASYCFCQGGVAPNGDCGPGAACAQSTDCDEVCSDVNGPGGTTSGGETGGGSGGGQICEASTECGMLSCCDGGPAPDCLQGVCTCPEC